MWSWKEIHFASAQIGRCSISPRAQPPRTKQNGPCWGSCRPSMSIFMFSRQGRVWRTQWCLRATHARNKKWPTRMEVSADNGNNYRRAFTETTLSWYGFICQTNWTFSQLGKKIADEILHSNSLIKKAENGKERDWENLNGVLWSQRFLHANNYGI